jgi:hypothetical protein
VLLLQSTLSMFDVYNGGTVYGKSILQADFSVEASGPKYAVGMVFAGPFY